MCDVGDCLSSSPWDGHEGGDSGCDVAAVLSAKKKNNNKPPCRVCMQEGVVVCSN